MKVKCVDCPAVIDEPDSMKFGQLLGLHLMAAHRPKFLGIVRRVTYTFDFWNPLDAETTNAFMEIERTYGSAPEVEPSKSE